MREVREKKRRKKERRKKKQKKKQRKIPTSFIKSLFGESVPPSAPYQIKIKSIVNFKPKSFEFVFMLICSSSTVSQNSFSLEKQVPPRWPVTTHISLADNVSSQLHCTPATLQETRSIDACKWMYTSLNCSNMQTYTDTIHIAYTRRRKKMRKWYCFPPHPILPILLSIIVFKMIMILIVIIPVPLPFSAGN